MVKPVIVLETMAELGMSERYTPVGSHSSVHTIKGDHDYHARAGLPSMPNLQQIALEQFKARALEQYPDVDLIAKVRAEFGKPYVFKEESGVFVYEDTYEPINGEGPHANVTKVKFQQFAIDYRLTADLFKEIR